MIGFIELLIALLLASSLCALSLSNAFQAEQRYKEVVIQASDLVMSLNQSQSLQAAR